MLIQLVPHCGTSYPRSKMFQNKHYITRGIDNKINIITQLFLWKLIGDMPEPKDYLQVFNLTVKANFQCVEHSQERPEYCKSYAFPCEKPVTEKIYVIDDNTHSTMLLAEEY